MGSFAEAEEASLRPGILRCRVGRGGAQVEGFVEDFACEDCIGECGRVGAGEEGVSDVGGWRAVRHAVDSDLPTWRGWLFGASRVI